MKANLECLAWILGSDVYHLPYEVLAVLEDLFWKDEIVKLIHVFQDYCEA